LGRNPDCADPGGSLESWQAYRNPGRTRRLARHRGAVGPPEEALIEAVVDPFTALLPAKITANQAVKFSEALMRGEPNRMKIALTAASDTVRQIV